MTRKGPEKQKKEIVSYGLKTMVLARILAELTVFIILLALPLVALGMGKFEDLSLTLKFLLISLSAVSAVFIPAYGFVTFKVTVDGENLESKSLFRHQRCSLKKIKSIKRRSSYNWQRYVVSHAQGELTFPVWLKDVDTLVTRIKACLPAGAPVFNPLRRFMQDPIAIVFQIFQALVGVCVTIIFWIFLYELSMGKQSNMEDLVIVLAFCVLLSAVIVWRTITVALMPKGIDVAPDTLTVETFFFSRKVPWSDVLSIKPSLPMLPQGFMIRTRRGSFLIGDSMDSADEVVAAIRAKVPQKPERTQ